MFSQLPLALGFMIFCTALQGFSLSVNMLTGMVLNQGGLAWGRHHRLVGLASQAVELPGCWHEGTRMIFFAFQNAVLISEWSVHAPHAPLSLQGCGVLAGSLLRTLERPCWLTTP